MSSVIGPGSANVYQDVAPVQFQFKEKWSDPWQTITGISPKYATISSGNADAGMASFSRRYGRVLQHDDPVVQGPIGTSAKLDIGNWWCRILASPYTNADIMWLGKVRVQNKTVFNRHAGRPEAGEQTFTCYDGIDILRRRSVSQSIAEYKTGEVETLRTMMGMNINSSGDNYFFNRSNTLQTAANGEEFYPFSGFISNGYQTLFSGWPWDSGEFMKYIVEGILNDANDPNEPIWTLVIPEVEPDVTILNNSWISVGFDDIESALSMMQKVLPKKHGFDFLVRPSLDDSGFIISVFSLTPVDVVSSSSGTVKTLTANPNKVSFDLTSSVDSVEKGMEISYNDQYKTIRVLGDPIICCATFSFSDLQVVEPWEEDQQDDYEAGTGNAADTPDKHDDFRKEFPTVFQDFLVTKILDDWPSKARPKLAGDGTLDFNTELNIQLIDRQTLDWLPFYEDVDYSVDPPVGASASWERRSPFALLRPIGSTEDHTHVQADVQLQVNKFQLGVTIKSEVPHYIAANSFTAPNGAPTGVQPYYGYDDLKITIAWEHDERLGIEHQEPDASLVSDGIIDIYEPGNAWAIAPNTIFKTENFVPVMTPSTPMVLHNDIDRLLHVMNGAKARYLETRARAQFKIKGLLQWTALIGQIVETITTTPGEEEINGPITSIRWDFVDGYSTSFSTGFAPLKV